MKKIWICHSFCRGHCAVGVGRSSERHGKRLHQHHRGADGPTAIFVTGDTGGILPPF